MQHSIGGNIQTNAMRLSHNSIQGHHHSKFGVQHYADANQVRWSMSVGCLVDPHSVAARYAAGAVMNRAILGCGVILGEENFLVISDMHMPYHHRDSFDFLYALKEKYKCTTILNVGDLYDHHAGSYHESEPDALNPEQEYEKAMEAAYTLQSIFPEMVVTNGNHDKIPQRKLKSVGLPPSMLSDYNKLYGTDKGWVFTDRHTFNSKGGEPMTKLMRLNKRGRWDGKI